MAEFGKRSYWHGLAVLIVISPKCLYQTLPIIVL